MKTLLTTALLISLASVASAQPAGPADCCAPAPPSAPADPTAQPQPQPPAQPQPVPAVAYAPPQVQQPAAPSQQPTQDPLNEPDDDEGWKRPAGRRFVHGFRLGYMFLFNHDEPSREGGMSLKNELGLKTPHMMLLGYEGFYRIVGHSWLNVILVGNVTVAGLEQSKPIPAASGLIGFELQKSFQLGVGVNLTPDAQSPSHAIIAAGWTPRIGSIHTPVHFFFVPDPTSSDMDGNRLGGNHRMGATIGMSW
jgi:hypothetical protein